MSGEQELEFAADAAGERLDRFLVERLPGTTRAEVQRWIKEERASVNGRPAKPSHRLAAGDRVVLRRPPLISRTIEPEPIPLTVAYEDADLLVIDKPAGMVVHPAPGHLHGTLVNALLFRDPQLAEVGGAERAGIVHRLDRDTSGLILVAKHAEAHRVLQRQFKTRRVQKIYLALVHGSIAVAEGRIEAPIGRDPTHRQRMAVVPVLRGGRPAVTAFRRVALYLYGASAQRHEFSLLELDLLTGRTHQIRVHLAFLKHPVVGDRVYGRRRQLIPCPRQFLHAAKLSFVQPLTGVRISVEAPLPPDLCAVLDALEPQ